MISADGIVYLRDVCLTLVAFLAVVPAAAPLIVGIGGSNLAALAPLYDELLPALESSAQRQNPPASGVSKAVPLAIPITSWSVACSMTNVNTRTALCSLSCTLQQHRRTKQI